MIIFLSITALNGVVVSQELKRWIMNKTLKIEISLDDFTEAEKEKGWHRKKFFCPDCDLLIRIETWSHYMFGLSTILKTNNMPNYCPNCGVKIIYEF